MTAQLPIRVLELRTVRGTGGGPEKTILLGAARSDPARFNVTVCYIRDRRDPLFDIARRANALKVDYVEVEERHSLDLSAWRAIRGVVRDRRIDIVHSHEYKTDLIAAYLARVEPVRALATVHGWSGHSTRERWLYYPADKRLLRRFPAVVAVSSDIAQMLIAAGVPAGRISVVLNGIDHREYRRDQDLRIQVRRELDLADADFVIGAVGRIEREKRYDLLVTAFADLVGKYPHLRLFVVGEGSLRPQVEATARKACPAGRCVFLGHRTDVARLYNAFDLLVQSSENEGTPNALLEAIAVETPIVATDVGGTTDLVEPDVHAIVVPARDAAALASGIESALIDPTGTRQRALRARERVEQRLSFDARMRSIEQVYENLMIEPRRDEPEFTRRCS